MPDGLDFNSKTNANATLFTAANTQSAKRAKAWLDARVAKMAREGCFAEQVTITPELAELLLRRNPNNRNLVAGNVRRLAEAMRRGDWTLNGETLIVSADGFLNDGQHRLKACVESGVSFPTFITFGVTRESRESVDIGAKRDAGMVLGMAGVKDAANVASAVKFILNLESGVHFNTHRTPQEVKAGLLKYANVSASVRKGRAVNAMFRGSCGGWIGLHYLMSQSHAKKADEFFAILTNGVGITSPTHPIGLLRDRLTKDANAKAKLPWTEVAAITIKAWNNFKAGRPMATLRWSTGGEKPEAFPRIM